MRNCLFWIIGLCLVAAALGIILVGSVRRIRTAKAVEFGARRLKVMVLEHWIDTDELPLGPEGDSYVVETNPAFVRWLRATNPDLPDLEDSFSIYGITFSEEGALVDPWGMPLRITVERWRFYRAKTPEERTISSIEVESAGPDRDFLTKRDNPHSF